MVRLNVCYTIARRRSFSTSGEEGHVRRLTVETFTETWAVLPTRTRRLLLAGTTGLLWALGHPSAAWWPVGWVALVPLLLLLADLQSWKTAALYGWAAGLVAFLGIVGWLYILGQYTGVPLWLGWIVAGGGAVLLAAYLALYPALFAALVVAVLPRRGGGYLLGVPMLWTAVEWIRGWALTGFPWGALGYTQWNFRPALMIAALGGAPLVGWMVAAGNAVLAVAWRLRRAPAQALRETWPGILPILIGLIYGTIATGGNPTPEGSLRVAVVPGNIPQTRRWSRTALLENLDHYLRLMDQAAAQNPDLIVLPETALLYDYYPPEQRERLHAFLQERNVYLIFGAPRVSRQGTLREGYNAVLLMDPNGRVLGEYDKQHLVPFGEYIPFRRYLPKFLTERIIGVADYHFGEEAALLEATIRGTPVRVGTPICFESVFPGISREFVNRGANLLAIVTNDGWYEGTPAIPQHFVFSVFRAVESGRAVVRAANRGISAIIEPTGRVRESRIPATDPEGIIVEEVPLYGGLTLYARVGDWISVIAMGWLVVLLTRRFGQHLPRNEE